MIYAVALDGPSGAGKSTIAKQVAQKTGIIYVDTGAMYRTIALYMIENNVDLQDVSAIEKQLKNIEIHLQYRNDTQAIYLNGIDVSDKIRQNQVSMAASVVAAYPFVRSFLLQTQRNVAAKQSVIMDGRDIGTVVLPDAQIKIFMIADPEVRAQRRHKELLEKGQTISYQQVLQDIVQRDYNDTHRASAPLKQATDAVLLDTTHLDLSQAVDAVINLIAEKLKEIS